jgi:hypothetical protein
MKPLVSIVVNNYNYAAFLRRAIDSALDQTYAGTEVVVVDDASKDGSRQIITSYGPRIVPVLLTANGGQGAALSAGFAASHGDVIVFLDSDDWLYPHAAERIVMALRPEVAIIQYRLHLVDADGHVRDLYPRPEIAFDRGDVVRNLLKSGRYENTVTSGNAFTRRVLARVMPIPAAEFRIAADGYLVSTAPLYGSIAALDEPLGAYRQHGTNTYAFPRGRDADALGQRLRHALDHDAAKHRALAAQAAQLGLVTSPDPGLHQADHLVSRLASLRIDPSRHPYRSDRLLGLSLRGLWEVRSARLPWRRRAVLAAWFVSVGVLPRRLAALAVFWRLSPRSRPEVVDRVLKRVRYATQ